MRLRQFGIWVAVLAHAFAACTRVEVGSTGPGVSIGDGGGAGAASGGAGSLAGSSGDGGSGAAPAGSGAPGNVELAVWPTFAAAPQQQPGAQAVLAAVSTLSLGSSTLPLSERWDALSGATGSPRAVTWNRLDAMVQPYRDRGASVALCIDIVDRQASAWPFSGDLEGAAATSAMQRTIDEVYARYASQLSHLCFGYEIDRYLAQAPAADRQRLLAFVADAVAYAGQHPLHTARTAIGVAITLDALVEASSAPLDALLLGDEVVAVYDPLDAHAMLKPPDSIANELPAALATIAAMPGPKLPLALFEVGYPSGSDVGSSEKAQRSFYDALFGRVESERDDVAFIGAYGLGDRAAAECQTEAAVFGGTVAAQAERALVRCSMGLRAEGPAAEKLAWPSVVAALSRYR